jgi:hypothetical protein
VHITFSNLKRFLLGTHHQPQAKHLKRYLAEFTYWLNRRWQEASLFEHLTQACLSTNTIIYRDLVAMPETLIIRRIELAPVNVESERPSRTKPLPKPLVLAARSHAASLPREASLGLASVANSLPIAEL